MSYILATTENKVRWYKFSYTSAIKPGEYTLSDKLVLSEVPAFGNKESAKFAALSLGLKTWRYVRI